MESVVVAKMDADAHTPPAEFELESYPTLLFLKVSYGIGVLLSHSQRHV